jgi:hypothetical protein
MVFLLLTLLVYVVATYLGQFGYAFAWYAIVAAADIFASPMNLYEIDRNRAPRSVPPNIQLALLHIDLALNAVAPA